jgi:hypothetical protein
MLRTHLDLIGNDDTPGFDLRSSHHSYPRRTESPTGNPVPMRHARGET